MNVEYTRQWFDAERDASDTVIDRASPTEKNSLFLALQLGTIIAHCRWDALETWEGEAQERPSPFSTMGVAIIHSVREAAKKMLENGQIFLPGEWTVLKERMSSVIDADSQTPAFADAVSALAEQLQPALLNTLMKAPPGYGEDGLESSLHIMSATVGSGIPAIAPKSSKPGWEGVEENQTLASVPLVNRDPRAVVFALLSDVARTIYEATEEARAYANRNTFIWEPLPDFKKWTDRVRENPLPVSAE